MENILYSIGGILIPFIGTTLGSSLVFFMKKNMSEKFQKTTIGFAAGVMIAASIWSLILPAIEMAENQGVISWLPATVGFMLGITFLILINKLADKCAEKNNGKKLNMLMFSVTLHNIPEGMAVGVCFVGFLSGIAGITLLEAIVLAIGIAIQNIPEGAIISMPLKMEGTNKKKAFLMRCIIRYSRANRSSNNNIINKYSRTNFTIPTIIRSRSNDIRSNRRTNSRNAHRK